MTQGNKSRPIVSYCLNPESDEGKVAVDLRTNKDLIQGGYSFVQGNYLCTEVRERVNTQLTAPPQLIIGEMIFEDCLEDWMTRDKRSGVDDNKTPFPNSLSRKLFATALYHLEDNGLLISLLNFSRGNCFTTPRINPKGTIPASGELCSYYQDFQVFQKPDNATCIRLMQEAKCDIPKESASL